MDYKVRDPEAEGEGLYNARAYHATSDIYPDPDWSVLWLLTTR